MLIDNELMFFDDAGTAVATGGVIDLQRGGDKIPNPYLYVGPGVAATLTTGDTSAAADDFMTLTAPAGKGACGRLPQGMKRYLKCAITGTGAAFITDAAPVSAQITYAQTETDGNYNPAPTA